jgi:hypothetical protein
MYLDFDFFSFPFSTSINSFFLEGEICLKSTNEGSLCCCGSFLSCSDSERSDRMGSDWSFLLSS